MIYLFQLISYPCHCSCLRPQTEYKDSMAAAPLLMTIVSRDSECMAWKKVFTIFYFVFMIWYFLMKFLPTDLLSLFISQAGLDWKWRHHLHPPCTNSNRKQCMQGKGAVVFPSHFFTFLLILFHQKVSLMTPNSDTSVLRLNPRQYLHPPHTNNNRKQGPGQVRLGCHSIFYTFSWQHCICPLLWVIPHIFACLIYHNSCIFLGKIRLVVI